LLFEKGTATMRGTALIDGRYAEFQAAVLQQLPREIHPDILKHWIDDRESLKRVLDLALVPVRMTDAKLHLDRSKPFNPAEFIGAGWGIWRGLADGNGLEGEEEQDARSLVITEVDLNKVILDATLNAGENYITGEERLRRLEKKVATKMDAAIFQALWNNKHLIPERFKEKTNGNTTYVFVDGTTLRSPDGFRYSLFFAWDAGLREWSWGCRWLGRDRVVSYPSALLAS
jgi:hypothetical protein